MLLLKSFGARVILAALALLAVACVPIEETAQDDLIQTLDSDPLLSAITQDIRTLCTESCSVACVESAQRAGFCAPSAGLNDAVTIRVSRAECVAPCGVFFEAQLNDDFGVERPRHELSYQWRFGDPDAVFTALPADFPDELRDANSAQGPMAGHVFDQSGTYEVRLTVASPDQNFTEAVTTVTVLDPDEYYAGSWTVCYSGNGNFEGCPSGAQRFTDLQRAVDNSIRSSDYRLLLRAGEETLLTGPLSSRATSRAQVGRFGEGPNPILRIDGNTFPRRAIQARATSEFTVWGLDVRGDYDPTTGLGDTYNTEGLLMMETVSDLTVYQNQFRGLGKGINSTNAPSTFIVTDNTISDWYDYGFFDGTSGFSVIVGNSIKQNPNAVSGPGGKDASILPRWADHGPVRTTRVSTLIVAQNDLLSSTGWSTEGQGHQPPLRYNQGGVGGHFGIINRNRMEGGYIVVSLKTDNGSRVSDLGDILVERNFLKASDNTLRFFSVTFGNTTIRNNVAVMPDVPSTFSRGFEGFVEHSEIYPMTADNAAAPVWVTDNTFVSQQSGGKAVAAVFTRDAGSPLTFNEANNLVHAPNAPNAADFVDMTPLDQEDFYRPLPGSAAINAGTPSNLVQDTFDGLLRQSTPSLGALEPTEKEPNPPT